MWPQQKYDFVEACKLTGETRRLYAKTGTPIERKMTGAEILLNCAPKLPVAGKYTGNGSTDLYPMWIMPPKPGVYKVVNKVNYIYYSYFDGKQWMKNSRSLKGCLNHENQISNSIRLGYFIGWQYM